MHRHLRQRPPRGPPRLRARVGPGSNGSGSTPCAAGLRGDRRRPERARPRASRGAPARTARRRLGAAAHQRPTARRRPALSRAASGRAASAPARRSAPRYPHRLWTSNGIHACVSGFTPYAARLSKDWLFFVQCGPRVCACLAIAGFDVAALLFAGFLRSRVDAAADRYPHSLWTSIGIHARVSGFTPCAARVFGVWRYFVQRGLCLRGRQQALRFDAAALLFAGFPRTRCGAHADRYPHRLWTSMRTVAVESGSTPCTPRLARVWLFFVQAVPAREALAASRSIALFCGRIARYRRVRVVSLSTQPVDKHADTRRGIGFHALYDGPRARLASFCPTQRIARAVRVASRRRNPAPLSTPPVDKHADSRAGIGFHACNAKASARLAKYSPARGRRRGPPRQRLNPRRATSASPAPPRAAAAPVRPPPPRP